MYMIQGVRKKEKLYFYKCIENTTKKTRKKGDKLCEIVLKKTKLIQRTDQEIDPPSFVNMELSAVYL